MLSCVHCYVCMWWTSQYDLSCNCGLDFSALELLLIKKRVKGPCWLSIAKPQRVESSSQVLITLWTYFIACYLKMNINMTCKRSGRSSAI